MTMIRLAITAMIAGATLGWPARAAEDVELWSAYAAAFGQRSAVTTPVDKPEEPPGSGNRTLAETVPMTIEPEALVRLDGDRSALIAFESIVAPHFSNADPGAIAVAYLRRTPAGWRLERLWREVTWSGWLGQPADRIAVISLDGSPAIAAYRTGGLQGEVDTLAWIVSLLPDGPKPLGHARVGGYVTPDACPSCIHYAYEGRIGPPTHEGAALSIAYAGWTVPGFHTRPRTPFAVVVDYDETGGALIPERDPHLPDGVRKIKPGEDPPSAADKAAARLPAQTPRAFANQIVALYGIAAHKAGAGRLWDQWHDSLYDPDFLALIEKERQLENRAGELDFDHDPLCGCNGDPAYARILKIAPRPDGMAEVTAAYCSRNPSGHQPAEGCHDVDLVIARIGDAWRLYDVLEPRSDRAALADLIDRLRAEPVWTNAPRPTSR